MSYREGKMELNRRKMFGAAIGGAVAGPELAKRAISEGAKMFLHRSFLLQY